jgi:aromatase
MSQPVTREVSHEIEVVAPADAVYRMIADVGSWPQVFPPTIHVEQHPEGDGEERIRIWATANGEAKTWTSRRSLDPAARRITFRQEVSQPPVGAMGGTWIIEPRGDDTCRVQLLHDYRAVDDDPAKLDWIDQAVDRNSRSELGALKANAELATNRSDLLISFTDSVPIAGAEAGKHAFDFIDQAQLWEERLPHVARVELTEDSPGLQVLEMDTMTKDGSTHTTRSVRVCLPPTRIVYKQVVLPALMTLHTGYWLFADDEDGDGVTATSQHTVAINEANIAQVLGDDADVEAARTFVRNALSGNSLATLGHAKAYAEARR